MSNRWVITDIHGCAKTFRELVEEHVKLSKDDELFLLGDYVDRGPDSKGVIDYIFKLQDEGYNLVVHKGNHEESVIKNINDDSHQTGWYMHGGKRTLDSFGVDHAKDIPKEYIDFIECLEYYTELDDYVLVHAGLNFEIDDPFSDKHSMLWIRNQPVFPEKIGHRQVVHGHTPIELNEIMSRLDDPKETLIDLDNGCVYREYDGLGKLCALELNSRTLVVQSNIDY